MKWQKKNQYELIENSVIDDGAFYLNHMMTGKKIQLLDCTVLKSKCDEQSRRFVTEDNIPK